MKTLIARIERLPLAPISALMLGGAAAFFTLAMPVGLIERFTVATGIAAIVPAAAPPLGDTARMLLVALAGVGGALLGGGSVLLAGGRKAKAKPAYADEIWSDETFASTAVAPAKPRAPLLATRDLGSPEPVTEAVIEAEAVTEAELEPFELTDIYVPEPVEAEATPEVEAQAPAEPKPTAPAPLPSPAAESSISDLMGRFESGLTRRATSAISPAAEAQDDPALREALEELKRIASR